jgi:hypothetical protein
MGVADEDIAGFWRIPWAEVIQIVQAEEQGLFAQGERNE